MATEVFPLHLADVSFPIGHPQAGDRGPVLGFAVASPDGVLLYDTGIGDGEPEVDEWYRPERRSLRDALGAHGIDLGDVTAVANSHLHFDHCGWNRLFPRRPIYVQASEHRAAHGEDYTVPAWVDFPDAFYEQLDGEAEVLPGVRLLSTPGHTPGHQSLLIEEELTVVAGQAVYTVGEWGGSADPRQSGEPSAWDRAAYADSVRRLHELGPARVLFSHDLAEWTQP